MCNTNCRFSSAHLSCVIYGDDKKKYINKIMRFRIQLSRKEIDEQRMKVTITKADIFECLIQVVKCILPSLPRQIIENKSFH